MSRSQLRRWSRVKGRCPKGHPLQRCVTGHDTAHAAHVCRTCERDATGVVYRCKICDFDRCHHCVNARAQPCEFVQHAPTLLNHDRNLKKSDAAHFKPSHSRQPAPAQSSGDDTVKNIIPGQRAIIRDFRNPRLNGQRVTCVEYSPRLNEWLVKGDQFPLSNGMSLGEQFLELESDN